MNTNSKTFQLVFLAVTILISLALLALSVTSFMHIQETMKEIDLTESSINSNQNKLSELIRLSKREGEFREALETMNKLLPNKPEEANIINSLNSISSTDTSGLMMIQFDDWVVDNNINTIPMTLEMSGKYTTLVNILNQIATGERLILIDEIIISQSDVKGTIDAEINARAFFR